MAWTSVGFDGTITEIQWAGLAGLLGNGYVAAGNGDCLVTAVGGARQVSVAAGSLYGDGVLSTNSGAETVALTTPTNGQWYVIALRRTWATNTAALVAIAGATTSTSTPTAAPTSFPTLNTNVGVLTDQPIAWAWCNSANTTVVVYDIRLKPVKSLPPVVATSAERDAKFMSPTQGLQVWRDDLGAVETYYGLYNASTNPGGRDTAGWYTDTRAMGLVPVRPNSVVIATGTGSTNALGVVSFSGATTISLNNIFTSAYRNYRISINVISGQANSPLNLRFRNGGVDGSGTWYQHYAATINSTAITRIGASSASSMEAGYTGGSGATYSVLDIASPATTDITFGSMTRQYNNEIAVGGFWVQPAAYDGFSVIPAAGNITGVIQVFGYND